MFGFFKSKLEKDAQAAIRRRAQQAAPQVAAKAGVAPAAPSSRERDLARLRGQAQALITQERQALIANAMKVHRAKREILDQLDDESRAKLVAMAITALMREGDQTPAKSRKKK